MRLGIILQKKMYIVCGDDLDAEFGPQLQNFAVGYELPLVNIAVDFGKKFRRYGRIARLVEHHLEVEIVTEEVLVPACSLFCLVQIAGRKKSRNLTC